MAADAEVSVRLLRRKARRRRDLRGGQVQRFILEANIARFEKLLVSTTDEAARRTMRELVASERRELSLMDAASQGAESHGSKIPPDRDVALEGGRLAAQFLEEFESSSVACMLIDPGPNLKIVDINPAFAVMAQVEQAQVVGRPLFEAFPENPGHPEADGVSNLYRSLQTVARTGSPDAMELQRYDTRDAEGRWRERYWMPVNMPVCDSNGQLIYLMQQVEEVTDRVRRGGQERP
jgi:PAS domain-containing protein